MEDDQNGRQPRWKTTKMEDTIILMLYFDGSNTAIAVSVYVKNIFKCGKIVIRLLKNKIKLVPNDATTTPRAEPLATLICMRLLETVQIDLKQFFLLFTGKMLVEVYGEPAT